MSKLIDITGMRFGSLVVLHRAGTGKWGKRTAPTWLCRCDCGREIERFGPKLRSGHVTSCGCAVRKHGCASQVTTSEYYAWRSMKSRCDNPNNRFFSHYGGRGISVCDRWRSDFRNFLADLGPKPSPRHSLDRIDNDGIYEPGNCRWADRGTQANNKRNNRLITIGGISLTIPQWAKRSGIECPTLKGRLRRGWSPERAISVPAVNSHKERERIEAEMTKEVA